MGIFFACSLTSSSSSNLTRASSTLQILSSSSWTSRRRSSRILVLSLVPKQNSHVKWAVLNGISLKKKSLVVQGDKTKNRELKRPTIYY